MLSTRQNTKSASDVADGISMIGPFGRYEAAHYMRLCGVRFSVIVRVLANKRAGARLELVRRPVRRPPHHHRLIDHHLDGPLLHEGRASRIILGALPLVADEHNTGPSAAEFMAQSRFP